MPRRRRWPCSAPFHTLKRRSFPLKRPGSSWRGSPLGVQRLRLPISRIQSLQEFGLQGTRGEGWHRESVHPFGGLGPCSVHLPATDVRHYFLVQRTTLHPPCPRRAVSGFPPPERPRRRQGSLFRRQKLPPGAGRTDEADAAAPAFEYPAEM